MYGAESYLTSFAALFRTRCAVSEAGDTGEAPSETPSDDLLLQKPPNQLAPLVRCPASEPNYSTLFLFTSCPFFDSGPDTSALAPEPCLAFARPDISGVYGLAGSRTSSCGGTFNPTACRRNH